MTDGPLIVYTDGASRGNPGPSAIGVFICTPAFKAVDELSELLPDGTNNEAEYHAVIRGLKLAGRHTRGTVEVRSDSELVMKQMSGEYRTRKPELAALQGEVKAAQAAFLQVTYTWVPREDPGTARADGLANKALTAAGYPKSQWPPPGRR